MSSPELTQSTVDTDASIPASSLTEHATNFASVDKGGHVLETVSQPMSEIDEDLDATTQDSERDGGPSDVSSQGSEHAATGFETNNGMDETTSPDNLHSTHSSHDKSLEYAGRGNKQDGIFLSEEENEIDEADIFQVHDNLVEVVASMRFRQQEQRHLHELTVQKVEAVAQRCILQEQQIQELLEEMRSLRDENQMLGHENDKLRDTIAGLEAETCKKEIAVSAMTSAVAGLEGWIGDAEKARMESIAPGRAAQPRRAVIRGKGRFRGRHYVDHEHDLLNSSATGPDMQELQEGVKAWIRGFRDVEDACNSALSGRMKELYREPANIEEDDWGDFQTPNGTAR